jgi:hypothetical protein
MIQFRLTRDLCYQKTLLLISYPVLMLLCFVPTFWTYRLNYRWLRFWTRRSHFVLPFPPNHDACQQNRCEWHCHLLPLPKLIKLHLTRDVLSLWTGQSLVNVLYLTTEQFTEGQFVLKRFPKTMQSFTYAVTDINSSTRCWFVTLQIKYRCGDVGTGSRIILKWIFYEHGFVQGFL